MISTKILTMVTAGFGLPEPTELRRLEMADEYPRVLLFEETLNSDMVNERFLSQIPRSRRLLYRPLPTFVAQVFEAFLIKNRYDAVISWAERLGLPFALLLKLTGSQIPHVAILPRVSKPRTAKMLRRVSSHIDRMIFWSSVQRDFAVNTLKIAPSKAIHLKWLVDQNFWRPMARETDMICSVGREMRDYRTLVAAMQGVGIRCHIAAGTGRRTKDSVGAIDDPGLPPNVTVGRKSFVELRELYARSRFVVVPLLPTDSDNGVSVIVQAMAMGKPVICSRTQGQVDVIQDGRTGIFVPPGDAIALREAIQYLWDHPDVTDQMGKEARKYIEENHALDQFVQTVKCIVEEVIREKSHQARNSEFS